MGRKTDVLLRGFRAAKCLTVLKLATSRIKVHRNKRSVSAKQMRGEIAQLLKTGQDAQVYITKAEALIKQENMVAVYDILDQYCHAIIARFPMIEIQSNCPIDMKEPIASLIFAAPRCVEVSELATIKEAFTAKYGKEFAAAAAELRPDCGVNKRVVELLSISPATREMKLKIMKEICAEYKVNWTPGEALAESSSSTQAGSSQQPVKTNVEAAKATGGAGPSKATIPQAAPSRINESASSNLSSATKPVTQGGITPVGINKPGKDGINKPGLAAVVTPMKPVVLTPDAPKPSGPKHDLASQHGVEKANASAPQSAKGAAITAIASLKAGLAAAGSSKTGDASVKAGLAAVGSSKTGDGAVFAANALKTNVRKEESTEEAILQSSQSVVYTGSSSAVSGSSKKPIGEPVAKTEGHVQPVVDPQDGSSDSDNDSFVSVEEGRFEDDAEVLSVGGASRRESTDKNSFQSSIEVDGHGPSLVKTPLGQRPHEDVYSKASSKKSSFSSESSQEVMFAKASRKNSLNTDASQEERPLRAESRNNSLREEKKSGDLIMESSITDALQQEKPFRAESRKNSLREEKSSGLFSESLKAEALQEEKPLKAESFKTKALQGEKPFREESRKSSFGEDKSSVLIVNTDALLEEKALRAESRKSSGSIIESSQEDIYARASSKKSSDAETLLEEKASIAGSRTSSLREKKLVEEKSFKHVEENNLQKQQLEEVHHFEENVEEVPQRKNSLEGVEYDYDEEENRMKTGDGLQENVFMEESLHVEKFVDSRKGMSFSNKTSPKEMPFKASKEVAGKESSSAIEESFESVSKQLDDVPPIEKAVPEIPGPVSLGDLATPDHFAAAAKAIGAEGAFGTLATPDDFAAAARAVAEEAARLAVLDYAKRMGGSGAIPVDFNDLTNFGLDFTGGSQMAKKLHSEAKTNITSDSKEAQDGGDVTNDIKEEASKMIGGMGYADLENSGLSKMPIADDGGNDSSNSLRQAGILVKDESLQQPHMDSGNHEINPFATEVDKASNSLFSEAEEKDSSSWAKPESMNKAGGFVQEEDHLDIFFRRKTPMFDDDGGYSFAKLNPSLLEEKAPYFGYGKAERISQDKYFVSSTPMFDSFPERQNVVVEESSGSFKAPVFDGGLEKDDASYSFDNGLDKKSSSVSLSDQIMPQFDMEASLHFDSEPEPLFDKVEEEEQPIIQKSEPAQPVVGQLKWQSKKPTKALEEGAGTETLGDGSKPVSRRTRKKPQIVDDYAYGSGIPAQAKLTSNWSEKSSSFLMQQQQKEQDQYDTADKNWNLRTKPAESLAYSVDAKGKRPSRSPERVSYDFSKENQSDRWDSVSSVGDCLPHLDTKKSPTRSSLQQKVPFEESDEDHYFSEEIVSNSARSRMSKPNKSPTRLAKQQIFPQGNDDDAEAYRIRSKPSWTPDFSRQDLADDDSFEEPPVAKYKPYRPNDELGMDTSSNLAMYRQKPHRQQEDYNSESAQLHYMQASYEGKRNPASQHSARQKQQYMEDEDDLAFGYKPDVLVDGRGKSSSTRPLSSRTKFEEEEQDWSPRYKPSARVSDVRRESSSPMSGRRQRYQRPQEEEQEVSIEEYEREEVYPKPLSDRHRQDHRREQHGLPRPRYRQKQGQKLEEESSDLSAEDYEQEQGEQRHPSILSEQRMPRRRLPYGQEKPQWPLPLSQEYEDEERMSRAQYGWKQDLTMEEEDSGSRIGDYGHTIYPEQKQARKEAKHQPLPLYRKEKQRRPSPTYYDQEEVYESKHLPDWRQEEQRKEERMSRPRHRQKQGSRLEEGTSDLSEEDYEDYWEEQEQSGKGKQERRRQENQRRPLPPLHQYEHEEKNEEFDVIPLPDWQQEEHRNEQKPISRPLYGKEKEPISRPHYRQTQNSRPEKSNVNSSMEDYEQQEEEPRLTSMSFEQEQYGREKHRRPSPPHDRQSVSKPEKDELWKQEKFQQEQQRPSSDYPQQQGLAEEEVAHDGREKERLSSPVYTLPQEMQDEKRVSEVARKGQEGREKERRPSPVYTRPQEIEEEKKVSEFSMEHNELPKEEKLQQSAAMPGEKQVQDGQGIEKRPWPLRNKRQESKEEIKEQLSARQSLSKDEGVKFSQEKPEAKAKPSSRRPSSVPDSPSLESSISDPVVLATIPPPVKKLSIRRPPEATTLESSLSTPSPANTAEVKGPKVPQKPPNVDDLLANFEAFRKARTGG